MNKKLVKIFNLNSRFITTWAPLQHLHVHKILFGMLQLNQVKQGKLLINIYKWNLQNLLEYKIKYKQIKIGMLFKFR